MKKTTLFIILAAAITVLAALPSGEALADVSVSYDVWVSATTEPAPYTPMHECWTFTFSGPNITLYSSGLHASGPVQVEYFPFAYPNYGLFAATLDLGSGSKQYVAGYFLNGPAIGPGVGHTIGGVMARFTTKNFSFAGVQNNDCAP